MCIIERTACWYTRTEQGGSPPVCLTLPALEVTGSRDQALESMSNVWLGE